MNSEYIKKYLRDKNPRISERRLQTLIVEYQARKIPKLISKKKKSPKKPALIAKLLKDKQQLLERIEKVQKLGDEGSPFLLDKEITKTYSEVLEQRMYKHKSDLELRRREREVEIRLKRYSSVSQSPQLKDTSYPTFSSKETTNFRNFDTAYSGPFDEIEWGPKARLFEWYSSSFDTVQPMTRFTSF